MNDHRQELPTPERGLLVVFEGVDGSGKSTLARAVAEKLMLREKKTALMPFPSHEGPIGKLIRSTFVEGGVKIEEAAMAPLFVADGLHFEPGIRKMIEEGYVVLLDRHATISGWVYQTDTHQLENLLQMNVSHLFYEPDLVLILDVPEEVAKERVFQKRGAPLNVVYEKDDDRLLTRRRNRYLGYHHFHEDTSFLVDGQLPTSYGVATVVAMINELRRHPR
jgi:dTMP kinase